MKRLTGRKILITGAGSGIGLAATHLFIEEGANVAALDLDTRNAKRAVQPTGGIAIDVDVSDEASVQNAVQEAANFLGGIDGVVNAAGIIALGPLATTQLETWQRQIAVNMTGPFLICRAALPWLQKSTGATIVNIASAQALRPAGASCGYAASKAGLLNFTKAIAAELAPEIRVNAICPGIVDTPMVKGVNQSAKKPDATPTLKDYPLGRMAQPEEIAHAILYLTSDESSYVTGTAHAVDGGRSFH
jgi:NAD(P)-dependent dehydrogenase (short-subunit alcohol dehydrogenase family)